MAWAQPYTKLHDIAPVSWAYSLYAVARLTGYLACLSAISAAKRVLAMQPDMDRSRGLGLGRGLMFVISRCSYSYGSRTMRSSNIVSDTHSRHLVIRIACPWMIARNVCSLAGRHAVCVVGARYAQANALMTTCHVIASIWVRCLR